MTGITVCAGGQRYIYTNAQPRDGCVCMCVEMLFFLEEAGDAHVRIYPIVVRRGIYTGKIMLMMGSQIDGKNTGLRLDLVSNSKCGCWSCSLE